MKNVRKTKANAVSLVMNSEFNGLRDLPRPQRLQVMIVLSVMWSTIFCGAFGAWFVYGELVIGHALVITGVMVTAWVFRGSSYSINRKSIKN